MIVQVPDKIDKIVFGKELIFKKHVLKNRSTRIADSLQLSFMYFEYNNLVRFFS